MMKKVKLLYHRHRFPAAVISCAVRWYFRFQLSPRDIEDAFPHGVVSQYLAKIRPVFEEKSGYRIGRPPRKPDTG